MENETLIDFLREKRGTRGYREFAEEVGVHFASLYRWMERRDRIGTLGLARIWRAYPTLRVKRAIWEYIEREGEMA